AGELAGYPAGLVADPAGLEAGHERGAALRALPRKYAEDVDSVLAWAEQARERLAALTSPTTRWPSSRPSGTGWPVRSPISPGGCRYRGGRRPDGSPRPSPRSCTAWPCRTPGSRWR